MRIPVVTAARRLLVAVSTSIALALMVVSAQARAAEVLSDRSALSENASSNRFDDSCFSCWAGSEVGCTDKQHRDSIHEPPAYFN